MKLQLWTLASDDDNGTQANVYLSEAEAECAKADMVFGEDETENALKAKALLSRMFDKDGTRLNTADADEANEELNGDHGLYDTHTWMDTYSIDVQSIELPETLLDAHAAAILKHVFPWLGTDDVASGATTVEDLAELYAKLTATRRVCANCGELIRPTTPKETVKIQAEDKPEDQWIHSGTGYYGCEGMQETYAAPATEAAPAPKTAKENETPWYAIQDILIRTGYNAHLNDTNNPSFLVVSLPDGRSANLYSNPKSFWTIRICSPNGLLDSSRDILNGDEDHPDIIAYAFRSEANDLCPTNNPALFGNCGEPDCVACSIASLPKLPNPVAIPTNPHPTLQPENNDGPQT
jgi:hypothetical protein